MQKAYLLEKIKILKHDQKSELFGFEDNVDEGVTKPAEEDDDIEAPCIGILPCWAKRIS